MMNIMVRTSNFLTARTMKQSLKASGHNVRVTSGKVADPIFKPDVVLVDTAGLIKDLVVQFPSATLLFLDIGKETGKAMTALLCEKIDGIISPPRGLVTCKRFIKGAKEGSSNGKGLTAGLARMRSLTSERESNVIGYVCMGYTNREIARELSLSAHTIKAHLNRIFRKLNVSNRAGLISLVASQAIAAR